MKINVRCCLIADIFMIHVTFSVLAAVLPVCPEVFSSGLYKYRTMADMSYLMLPNRVLQCRYVMTSKEKSKQTRNKVLFLNVLSDFTSTVSPVN